MNPLTQIIAAFIGTFGFTILFGAKRKYWLLIAIDGMLSWMLYLACCTVMHTFPANIITAAFCSLYAHIASRIVKAPTTCLLMPATVPMVPGGSLYYTMSYLLSGEMSEFVRYLSATCETIFAMAIGFALVSLGFRTYEGSHLRG